MTGEAVPVVHPRIDPHTRTDLPTRAGIQLLARILASPLRGSLIVSRPDHHLRRLLTARAS